MKPSRADSLVDGGLLYDDRNSHKTRLPMWPRGTIVMRENDAPFSRQYESYSLEKLIGQSFSVQDRFAQRDEVFWEMKPACPACGLALTEQNIQPDGGRD